MAKLTQDGEQTLLKLTRLREMLKTQIHPPLDETDPNLQEYQKVMTLIQVLERRLQLINKALLQVAQEM